MDKFTRKLITCGLAIVGIAAAGYRAHKIKKLQEQFQEESIIDITPEEIQDEPSRK